MRRAEKLDDELLEAYMQCFFGYGSLSGAYWLVGIEERGGDTLEDVAARLRAWDNRGRLELEDVFEFSVKAGQGMWFGPKARLQRTWANFIRIVLGAEGLDAGREKVRQYQSRHFGRAGGETCLVNLMPLPSRSSNEWHHAHVSTLPHLESRPACMEYYAELRAKHIQKRIAKYRPRAVIFGSMDSDFRSLRQIITDAEFEPVGFACHPFDVGRQGDTIFVLARHPAARRLPKEYFQAIGECIAQRAESVSTERDV